MAAIVVAEAPDQAVREAHGGRGPLLHARAGDDHRLPRPERRRQDDDAADAARPGHADERAARSSSTGRTPTSTGPVDARRRGARGDRFPPGPLGPQPSADPRHAPPVSPDSRADEVAAPRRARGGRRAPGQGLLARHAPAARARRGAARRARAARPRRARERPRPRGRSLAARLPAQRSPPSGRTVFVSSHVLAEVAQTVDRVLIINRGRLVDRGARSRS